MSSKPLLIIAFCLIWIGFLFFSVSRPPSPPEPFPDQTGRMTPSRAVYNPELAASLDQGLRDFWQKPEEVLDTLEPLEGLTVADIGCGEGYFTLRLLPRVGPDGLVYATDIQPEVLRELEAAIPEPFRDRATLALGSEGKLGFDARADLALLIQVLGEVEDQRGLLAQIAGVMGPDSRLALIDSKHVTDPATGYTRPINLENLITQLDRAGFEWAPEYDPIELNFLPKQFFFVLRLKPETTD